MSVVAKSYWRSILRRTRTFETVPANIRTDVKELAKQAVVNMEITAAQYAALIGESFDDENRTAN